LRLSHKQINNNNMVLHHRTRCPNHHLPQAYKALSKDLLHHSSLPSKVEDIPRVLLRTVTRSHRSQPHLLVRERDEF